MLANVSVGGMCSGGNRSARWEGNGARIAGDKVVREGFSEEGVWGMSHVDIWRSHAAGRGNTKRRGPDMRLYLAGWENGEARKGGENE